MTSLNSLYLFIAISTFLFQSNPPAPFHPVFTILSHFHHFIPFFHHFIPFFLMNKNGTFFNILWANKDILWCNKYFLASL